MNASALLKSQGWRGKGHSLHPTDNAIGLANPLLLSRNTDGSGIGHASKAFASDQWWMRAFDQKLQGLDTSKKGVVVQSVTNGQLDIVTAGKGGKYAGLYASFVRGGLIEGTLEGDNDASRDGTPGGEDREDMPGLPNDVDKRQESKQERRARKEAKRLRKAARAERKAEKAERARRKAEAKDGQRMPKGDETKEERQARRAERRVRKEARRKRREEKAKRKMAKG